jgi:hypothetical protein
MVKINKIKEIKNQKLNFKISKKIKKKNLNLKIKIFSLKKKK